MNETCFAATKIGLATKGAPRRGLLGGLAAGAVFTALGRGGQPAAAQKKKPLCQRCPNACGGMDLTFCKPVTETEGCACVKTIDGHGACVNFIGAADCPEPPGCMSDAECGPGKVCVPTTGGEHCCGAAPNTGNRCMARCF